MKPVEDMRGFLWKDGISDSEIHIRFSGTDATGAALKNWFETNGWTIAEDETEGREIKIRYVKPLTGYEAWAQLSFGNGMGYIMAGKNEVYADEGMEEY